MATAVDGHYGFLPGWVDDTGEGERQPHIRNSMQPKAHVGVM